MDSETLDLCMQNVMHYVQKIYEGSDLFERFTEIANRFVIEKAGSTEPAALKASYAPIIDCANLQKTADNLLRQRMQP